MDGLAGLHDDIARFFQALSRDRGGPVWIIEHPLTAEQLAEARGWLREALRRRPLDDSAWWRARAWPLLVEATEVGYTYEGPGNPYWPTVHEVLGRELRYEEHAALSAHFAAVAEVTARPPADPWSAQFRHMAWPVTHALLPLGTQLSLFAALIDHDQPLRLRDDPEGSVAGLRRRVMARQPRSRLLPLLERPRVAVSIIAALLGGGAPEPLVRGEVLRRFAEDSRREDALALAREARRRVARDERLLAVTGRRRRSSGRAVKEVDAPPARHDGQLQLRRAGDSAPWTLHVVPPALPGELAGRVPQRPFRPLGVGRGASLRSVARGESFPLGAVALPSDEERLIPDVAERVPDAQLALRLAAVHLDLRRPLLFAPSGHALSPARQVLRRRLSGAGPWLLLSEDDGPPGGVKLGEVAGLTVTRLSPPLDEAQRRWCAEAALGVIDQGRIEVFAPPESSADERDPPCWPSGATLFLRLSELVGGARVRLGDESIDVTKAAVVACALDTARAGPLVVEWQGEVEEIAFDVEPVEGDAPLVSVELIGEAQTLDALWSGGLSVAFRGDVPFAGLSAVLRLRSGERRVIRAALGLPALPCTIGAKHPAFAGLLRAADEAGALGWERATLTVEVAALAQRSWLLEETAREAWWREEDDGRWLPEGEVGAWGVGQMTLDAPWRLREGQQLDGSPATLLLALDGEGRPLLGSGLCMGAGRVSLSALEIPTPRRTLRSVTREASDGANVAELSANTRIRAYSVNRPRSRRG